MSQELVLISHGQLCEALKKSTEMIMGPQTAIHTVALLESDGVEEFKEKFLQVTDELDSYVVFCDLMGGTPCNVISRMIMEGAAIELYAGMNMPMVIEFINGTLIDTPVDFITSGQQNIVSVNQMIALTNEEEDE
ncbi:PTS sugar transporter subunit IIA [Enterococcus thailandicus]|uniref:PTS sugar transporter subunit IIA n=1 Tax=Enterococcus thailandicus TaxID=417368 RepID=UPI0022EBEC7A|nr:PTS fructose transporter subunit IIA [Enterococcus thailandicus]MDA3964458.1 PTS fructose transporter subunit IIA [Enterococcus thailandicus]